MLPGMESQPRCTSDQEPARQGEPEAQAAPAIVSMRRPPARHTDWVAVKEHFMVMNLDPTIDRMKCPYTLKDAAKAFGMSHIRVRTVAAEQCWYAELTERRQKVAEAAISRAQALAEESEAQIRLRQASLARDLQNAAGQALQRLLKDLETKPNLRLSADAIEKLLRTGMAQEREALGLPKMFAFADQSEDDDEGPIEKMRRQKTLRNLGKQLAELLEKGDNGGGSSSSGGA